MTDKEIREKSWKEYYISCNNAHAVRDDFMAGYKSRDDEVKLLQDQLNTAEEMADGIESCIGNPRTNYKDGMLYAEKQVKAFLSTIKGEI